MAEVEIDAEAFGFGFGEGAVRREAVSEEPEDCDPVPWAVDAWSTDYGKVWRPLAGSGREPRPGLLLSVVRAGVVVACPTPLPDPPTGALARALARVERPERPERRPEVLAVDVEPPPPPRRMPSQKAYTEVRALVGMVVEVLVGRRTATHAARWTDAEVRGKLRTPRYARTTTLKSVRLSESGAGVEALALLRDGARTRAVALRFDRDEDSRWRCTALQTG
ncbi:Rv3235 family protein [Catenulispora sp. GAS73]|uniref:Rv3235 family protein n=1 Tax=Catenulispora sp. GAS73 TaxID=3156269 RepID=UPI003518D15C